MDAADIIEVYASSADLSFNVFGSEIDEYWRLLDLINLLLQKTKRIESLITLIRFLLQVEQ
jgi:hypothetical protein